VGSGRSRSSKKGEPKASRRPKSKRSSSHSQPRATRLRIQSGDKVWVAKGYKAIEPPSSSRHYFANLAALYGEMDDLGKDSDHSNSVKKRILSVCIPCFNEEASALQRTIRSLRRAYLPPGVIMEILVVVDGKQQISPSMAKYLRQLFGISVDADDQQKNPFVTFPNSQTIIVENVSNGNIREPVTLLIKRTNKRKVNSQKWWLYGHAKDVRAEFVFATDCGIVFDRKCILLLIERYVSSQTSMFWNGCSSDFLLSHKRKNTCSLCLW